MFGCIITHAHTHTHTPVGYGPPLRAALVTVLSLDMYVDGHTDITNTDTSKVAVTQMEKLAKDTKRA